MDGGDHGMKLSLIFPTVVLYFITEVEAKYCVTVENGQTRHFACGPFQHCCGSLCCESFGPFYRLWYFWLCVMLALIFCSFGGYWYRRHYFQHRLFSAQNTPGQRTMMLFANNMQTDSRFDYGRSESFYPSRCEHPQDSSVYNPHQSHPYANSPRSEVVSGHAVPQSTTLSTPPPSYYETVNMPPPPNYAYFNSHANGSDQPSTQPNSEESIRRAGSGIAS